MVNQIKWYKRDPARALEGMVMLSLEERGAYNTILDLIYLHDGSVDDDDKLICFWLKCDKRVWKRLRAALIDRRKLYVHGNQLRNGRADRVIEDARDRITSASIAGLASAAKRASELKLLKHLQSTGVEQPYQQPTTTPTSKPKTFLSVGSALGPITSPRPTTPEQAPSLSTEALTAIGGKRG